MDKSSDQELIKRTLYFVAQHGWGAEEQDFLEAMVAHLAESLGLEYAAVCRLLGPDRSQAETVVLYSRGKIVDNFKYDLQGTPCENVVQKDLCLYERDIQSRFPDDELLAEMGAESYAGLPLRASDGEVIGIAAVLGCGPIDNPELVKSLLQIVSVRAAAGLERAASDKILRESETRFRDIAEMSSDWIWEMDCELRFTYLSDRYAELTGFHPGNRLGTRREDFALPCDMQGEAEKWAAHNADLKARRPFKNFEYLSSASSDGLRYVSISGKPVFDDDGNFLGYRGTATDTTQRKRAEQRAAATVSMFEAAIENMAQGLCIFDRDFILVAFNRQVERILDFPRNFLCVGMSYREITDFRTSRGDFGDISAEDMWQRRKREIAREPTWSAERSLANGTAFVYQRRPMPDGGFVATYTDITERKELEREAAEKTHLLEATLQNMGQGIAVFDAAHDLIAFNPQYVEITGLPEELFRIGVNRRDFIRYRLEHGDCGGIGVDDTIEEKIALSKNPASGERTRADGRSYIFQRSSMPNGGYISTVTDITERRQAEKQLQQAQKMEAVGQLTGGVAHDFNNLLAVSLGNIELAEEALREGRNLERFLAAVKRASERGASLTNQLLAFSRRQTLFSQAVDVGGLVSAMTDLLRRTLGETIDVTVSGDADLWLCKVDPHQLESAVLNLAINARDAMEKGGKLTIETANVSLDDDYAAAQADVEPGDYVMVGVTDTGTGIPKALMERIFDPFFTTKEVGRGSGLGLSMVYGFVKQSGGHVTVYSEMGKGTTIKLYLPRSCKAKEERIQIYEQDIPEARGETVLVVEDDPDVRTLSVALLRSLGYEILEAATGKSALKVLDSVSRMNLLFTDVVLPGGMSGPQLAAEVERRHPGIAVLYTSGYTDLANVGESAIGEGAELLQKPYRKADLARKVRGAIDRGRPAISVPDTEL
ncbi:MAG: PAS-domain containing protein [Alphaproteobacteria bacterium]|nr:PAS-domain containing protein [Alphaproteobacteria bacterium]